MRRRFIPRQDYDGGLKSPDGGIKIGFTHPDKRYFMDPDKSIDINRKNLPKVLTFLAVTTLCCIGGTIFYFLR